MLSGLPAIGQPEFARLPSIERRPASIWRRASPDGPVNKYIGETEKNQNRVPADAEARDALLLLHEGDAVLSNRTEVQSANNRYAKLGTSYLVPRLQAN